MASTNEKFMSICALEPYRHKSFEEVRIDDYLRFYQTTGKPPPPCPEHPTGDLERANLGMPPLFQPYPVPSVTASSSSTASSSFSQPKILNPAELPIGQEFTPTKNDTETYHSISCMTQYSFFSPVELRYYAYLMGHRNPPPHVKLDPFTKSTVTPSTASNSTPSSLDPAENFQSISTRPEFADHSFEELRVYYLLAGREVTSAEIKQYLGQVAPVPVQTPPTQFYAPTVPTPAVPSVGGLFGMPQQPTSISSIIQPKSTPSFSFRF